MQKAKLYFRLLLSDSLNKRFFQGIKSAVVLRTWSQLPKIPPQSQNAWPSLGFFCTLFQLKQMLTPQLKDNPNFQCFLKEHPSSPSSIWSQPNTCKIVINSAKCIFRFCWQSYSFSLWRNTSATEKKERTYTCFQLKQNCCPHPMESEMQW